MRAGTVQRTLLLQALRAMPGVQAWDSDANMVLVRVADARLYRAKEAGRARTCTG